MNTKKTGNPMLDAPGQNDETFGSDGGSTIFNVPGYPYSVVYGMSQASNKKLYVTGVAYDSKPGSVFWIACMDENGLIDTSFANNGYLTGKFEENTSECYGHEVLIREGESPDETRLILTGLTERNFALACFTLKGEPDLTFGRQGKIVHRIVLAPPVHENSDSPTKISSWTPGIRMAKKPSADSNKKQLYYLRNTTAYLLPDKKILMCGHYLFNCLESVGLVARLTENGELDSDADGPGYFSIVHPSYKFAHTQIQHLIIAPDGNYIVCGRVQALNVPGKALVACYHPNGMINKFYGGGGFTLISDGRPNPVTLRFDRISLLPAGGVVGVGLSMETDDFLPIEGVIVALNEQGNIDVEFNYGEPLYSTIDDRGISWWDSAVQPDGKVIAAGYVLDSRNTDLRDFAIMRILSDGKPDIGFNNGKPVRYSFSSENDAATTMVLQSTGNIVLAGLVYESGIATRFLG